MTSWRGLLTNLDPLAKTLLIASAISVMTYKGTLNFAACAYLFSAALAVFSMVTPTPLLRVYLALSPFIAGLSWFNAYVASLVPGHEPLSVGMMVALRILSLINFSVYFSYTTDPDDLVLSMIHDVKVPYKYAYTFSIAYLILIKLMEYYVEVIHSLKGRLAIKREVEALKLVIPLATSMLAYVSQYADALASSMEVRGFGLGGRSYWRVVKMGLADLLVSVSSILIAILLMLTC